MNAVDSPLSLAPALALGGGLGFGAAVLWMRGRLIEAQGRIAVRDQARERAEGELAKSAAEREKSERECAGLRGEIRAAEANLAAVRARAEAEAAGHAREVERLGHMRETLQGEFATLSAAQLESNSRAFLALAAQKMEGATAAAATDLNAREKRIADSLSPLEKHLAELRAHVGELEKARAGAYGDLTAQIKGLRDAQQSLLDTSGGLRAETAKLATSLRSSNYSGRWGELQLRNVIEQAGMLEQCDFFEQRTITSDAGKDFRPDVTIRLPSGHVIAIDSKAPLNMYLDAVNEPREDERARLLKSHAALIRKHCTDLSRKEYWKHLDAKTELTILFLPGEMFYSAALQADRELLNWSWEQNIVLATPTMLIALLRTIAHGWRAAAIEQNAQEVRKLGSEIFASLQKTADRMRALAKHLGGSVDAYNELLGTIERNVFVKARRFTEMGVVTGTIAADPPLEKTVRKFNRSQLAAAADEFASVLALETAETDGQAARSVKAEEDI